MSNNRVPAYLMRSRLDHVRQPIRVKPRTQPVDLRHHNPRLSRKFDLSRHAPAPDVDIEHRHARALRV